MYGGETGDYSPDYESYLTIPETYTGTDYQPGQIVDSTGWDRDKIKSTRDLTGAAFKSEHFLPNFEQYSVDNLGGMELNDMMANGNGDQWADMTSSEMMNDFYIGRGVTLGDRQSGLDFYNHFDGTEYDSDGNVSKEGTGVANISDMDVFGNYQDYMNLVGNDASAANAFNIQFKEDMQDSGRGDGSQAIDGKKSNDLSPEDEAKFNSQVFSAMVQDADRKGALNEPATYGGVNEDAKRITDSLNPDSLDPNPEFTNVLPAELKDDFAPFDYRSEFEKRMPDPDYFSREYGKDYHEPSYSPNYNPLDMYTKDDMTRIGVDARLDPLVDVLDENGNKTGEQSPTFLIADPDVADTKDFANIGLVDNPYLDEAYDPDQFKSTLSLLGVKEAPNVNVDEETGKFTGFIENAPWSKNMQPPDDSEANIVKNGESANTLNEQGYIPRSFDMPASLGLGATQSVFANPVYEDSFIADSLNESMIDPASIPNGWTNPAVLAEQNDWDANDFRVFYEYANSAKLAEDIDMTRFGGPRAASEYAKQEEQTALDAVDMARRDRENGVEKNPFSYATAPVNSLNPEAKGSLPNSVLNLKDGATTNPTEFMRTLLFGPERLPGGGQEDQQQANQSQRMSPKQIQDMQNDIWTMYNTEVARQKGQ